MCLVLVFLLCFSLFPSELKAEVPFEDYIAIQPKYDFAKEFKEGLAAVKVGDKWGFIDKTGKEVIKPKYENVYGFNEGLAAVRLGKKWGFVDKTGKEVIKPKYDEVFGYLAVLDAKFKEGLSAVSLNGKFGYIDKTGKEVIKHKYLYANHFSEGLAVVEDGYIDKTGKLIIKDSPSYDIGREDFSEGLASVSVMGKHVNDILYGYINKSGKLVIKPKYKVAYSFSEGLAAVEIDGKFGFINKEGKVVIKPTYYVARDFSEGLASITLEKDKRLVDGYINKKGEVVGKIQYGRTSDFSEGIASVFSMKYYRWGIMDKSGKELIPAENPGYVGKSSEGLIVFSTDNKKYGYLKNPLGAISQYKDFFPDEYWSQPMEWAVNENIIKGYAETNGTYIKPTQTLTEAEWITLFFREIFKEELTSLEKQNAGNWWANPSYTLASKYNIKTKGSITNQQVANQPITRGTLAQMLASFINKKQLTEEEAIQFLWENKLTTEEPSRYKPNNSLTRAEAITFFFRYYTSQLDRTPGVILE